MTTDPAALEELDKAATQGLATFDEDWHRCPTLFVGGKRTATFDKTWSPQANHTQEEAAFAQFVTALVNAYRTGQLVPREAVEKPQDHWTVRAAINSARALIEAGNNLCLMAETSGGTAGRDDAMASAIDHWAAERDKHKWGLRIIELEGHDPEVGAGYISLPEALASLKENERADGCPSCGGLNTNCPDGCGRDPVTGELNGTRLETDHAE